MISFATRVTSHAISVTSHAISVTTHAICVTSHAICVTSLAIFATSHTNCVTFHTICVTFDTVCGASDLTETHKNHNAVCMTVQTFYWYWTCHNCFCCMRRHANRGRTRVWTREPSRITRVWSSRSRELREKNHMRGHAEGVRSITSAITLETLLTGDQFHKHVVVYFSVRLDVSLC